jgi:tRNA nucleotidyltransferase/poly(A) polymerase
MIPIDRDILPILQGLYIVGGSVRDLLLGRDPHDYDIAYHGNPWDLAKKIISRTQGHLVELGKTGQKIVRVITAQHTFDISQLNRGSIEHDLLQRDFTINAMAYDLASETFIDLSNGHKDMQNKTICMVSDRVFQKDPVRLVRAFRLAAELDFRIGLRTETAIQRDAGLIRHSAGERIREEMFKMLRSDNSHRQISAMLDAELLTAILPELRPLQACQQSGFHTGNVLQHTLQAYHTLENLLQAANFSDLPVSSRFGELIGGRQRVWLKFAVLLHDIGKPATCFRDQHGIMRFKGHAARGAELAENICKRLKFANRETNFIRFIVRHHLRPLLLFNAAQRHPLPPKAFIKFYRKFDDTMPALLLHAIADISGNGKETRQKPLAFVQFANVLLSDFETNYAQRKAEPPLLSGQDLIRELGLRPSPLFSKILDQVETQRLAQPGMQRKEALRLAKAISRRFTAR